MTSDRTKYVFLDSDADRDDADFEHIKSLMPQHAVLERAGSASEITSGGFEQVVIISFNHGTILFVTKDYPQNGERLEPALSMVKLSFLDIDSENNKVYFAKSDSVGLLSTYDTGTPSTEYQSDQDLLGIITTLNADLFECNKKKLELVKAITSSVLEKRRAEISTELGTGDCKRILDGVKFSDSYADLQNKNRILESQSCPLLY
jgi:hypothetical protein